MKGYYYRKPSGEVAGPLPLDSIQAAMAAGRLPAGTPASETGGDPWTDANSVGRKSSAMGAVARLAASSGDSLMPCGACGGQIYKGARKCPHCGKAYSSGAGILLAVIVGLVIGIFLLMPTCSQVADKGF